MSFCFIPTIVFILQGNHVRGLELTAKTQDIPCIINILQISLLIKIQAVIGYGATSIECELKLSLRQRKCDEVRTKQNSNFVHPYNNPHMIAGQGTLALEFIIQLEGELYVLILGGGLLLGRKRT